MEVIRSICVGKKYQTFKLNTNTQENTQHCFSDHKVENDTTNDIDDKI